MKVVILCGGRGTRLREETEFRPKPMLPIGGRPVLWHIMKTYAHHGHKDFVLLLGYKGEQIKEYFRNYRWQGDVDITPDGQHFHTPGEDWNVSLVETGEDSGTGHRLIRARQHIRTFEPFLLTYGDGLSDININAVIKYHENSRNVCTLAAMHPPGRFGELRFIGHTLQGFNEKPVRTEQWVNGGFMVCEPSLLHYIDANPGTMLEQEPMRSLMQAEALGAFKHDGFFQPMDTWQEWKHLNAIWESGKAPWRVW